MTQEELIRQAAEDSLESFIKLVAPEQVLGQCHIDVINWWAKEDAKSHQLLLFPRDHGKSRLIAYRAAWRLTKDPTLRILYISATSNLAEKQLAFIKNIFESDIHRRYWPDHINKEEGKREKWTSTEINLDHPLRKKENIRDPSIFTGGLTTSLTGLHCDIAILDDVVVQENAYTREGRQKVKTQYSLLASIEGGEADEWVVGTRYFPSDLYHEMMEMTEDIYDELDEVVGEEPIYETYEKPVEDRGDGTGEFLWPRQLRKDGKWFGFNIQILAKKRGKYLDKAQYKAQYYNDPTDPDNAPIDSSRFQYYEKNFLTRENGVWYYKESKLNLFTAVDFAFSISAKADFTAIVVIGVDENFNIYVLDIHRFKTGKISEYFKHILELSNRWGFRKMRAEVTVAQAVIVNQLKEEIKRHGLSISIDEYRPTRNEGAKAERISSELEPRYDNNQIWHYRGGECQVLEDELITRNPSHDDVKNALADACGIAVKPASSKARAKRNSIDWSQHKFRG